ncbi:MAG: ribonuclease R, partial [Gammaproteobacteria bacterium]|nr:ribonuclease R [Gammaproteobacteria bacterium]
MPKRPSRRQPAAAAPSGAAASPYRHPIPDPNGLLDLLRRQGVPLDLPAIGQALGLRGERQLADLRRRLDTLRTAGQLLVNRRGEYCLTDKLDVLPGTVAAHRDGFGFLVPDDGSDDVFLSAPEMRSLLDGDRVAVRLGGRGRGGRRAGTLVEILARSRESLVGRYHRDGDLGWVVETGRSPHRFLVTDRDRNGAEHGQLVKLAILSYPDAEHEARGRVTEVLGDPREPRVLTDAAIEMFHIPSRWSPETLAAARKVGTEVAGADKRGRTDLRDLPLVTIDGEDARDFDDAVYAEPAARGWRLVVAIADVSHYVDAGDPIDVEARRRGTSVYFPDRVVPMLPEELSNELCSLKPRVDRLCMVCDMQVSEAGSVTRSTFYRAVMHSRARLTYTAVDDWQRRQPGAHLPEGVAPVIDNLYGVYEGLRRAREQRGALDLDLPEVRIRVAGTGTITGVTSRFRNDAHRLIEECMIAANVEAARYLRRHKLTTLYRVHAGPEGDKLEELRLLFQGLGIPIADTAGTQPAEINRVLQRIRDRPDFPMLATAVLRSMKQAVYQPANTGHFGLALGCYAHFTSPIRRYPDLAVHRGIGHLLDGGKPAAFPLDTGAAEQLGTMTSMQERRADEATRFVEARCKCLFMQEHVGATLDGAITGVTHFGLFVTLKDLLVDGLVHVTSLPGDYYHLEGGGRGLKGERTGRTFRLGDDLRVRVVRVDPDEARIDLALDGEEPAARRPPN